MTNHYDRVTVAKALAKVDDYMRPLVDKLQLLSDEELEVFLDAVANLANSVPQMGPVAAFEVLAKLGRLWARQEGADVR